MLVLFMSNESFMGLILFQTMWLTFSSNRECDIYTQTTNDSTNCRSVLLLLLLLVIFLLLLVVLIFLLLF